MMQNEARETVLILTGCNAATPAEQPARSTALSLGSHKKGWAWGKGRARSSIGERRWRRRRRRQSRRQMDQQMVSFRRIPEDDGAEGHTQRVCEREWSPLIEEIFPPPPPSPFCGSCSCSVITKGQQLLQPSLVCCGERDRQRRLSQNNPYLPNCSLFTECMSDGLLNVKRLTCERDSLQPGARRTVM